MPPLSQHPRGRLLESDLCDVASTLCLLNQIDAVVEKDGEKAASKEVRAIVRKEVSGHKSGARELFVPGKVIYAYHDGVEREGYHGAISDGTLPMIKTIVMASSMITDHLTDGYESAIAGMMKKKSRSDKN